MSIRSAIAQRRSAERKEAKRLARVEKLQRENEAMRQLLGCVASGAYAYSWCQEQAKNLIKASKL